MAARAERTFNSTKACLWALLLQFLSTGCSAIETLDLSQLDWKYRIGDASQWSNTSFDDKEWNTLSLPGALPTSPAFHSDHTIWFRVHIPSEQIPKNKSLSILFRPLQDLDYAYLNGNLIGSTGDFMVQARDYLGVGPAQLTRTYKIPDGLLSDKKFQVLAVRTQGFHFASDVGEGPMLLGPSVSLSHLARKLDLPSLIRDSLWLGVLFMGFCISLGVYGQGLDNRNKWLPPFLISMGLAAIPHSTIGFEYNLSLPMFVWAADLIPYILFGFLHIAKLICYPLTIFQLSLLGSYYLIVIGSLLWNPSVSTYYVLSHFIYLPLLASLAITLYHSLLAYRRKLPVSGWTYVALAVFSLSLLISILPGISRSASLDPLNIGSLIAIACFLLAISHDHQRDRRALRDSTAKLLFAQESERQRIAKELHDGINQRLLITRLRLEMIHRTEQQGTQQLKTPIEELRETGKEISTLVEGLRTVDLQSSSFREALQNAIERWEDVSKAEIQVVLACGIEPAVETQEQLLRIVQESLHNAARHSKATRINIQYNLDGNFAVLSIIDNGCGFDPHTTTKGLGLITMAERAIRIGAKLKLSSAPSRGTQIEVRYSIP